ncbi:hypothetical protein NHH03_26870 [Stieleria sp. TO1_6]|uniref:hypothetical protein n=1 Tax=Stieleria tagensis TaxID=2956795 RepID=UPI00209A7C2E|nr:hypothetical protein [Stieleria tagensis]MCO8125391.1 hypothetical protein [Stieleria tagensis]
MNSQGLGRDPVDEVLLGWTVLWSVALSVVSLVLLRILQNGGLNNDVQFLFGASLGGLSAVWTLIGAWIILVHLPEKRMGPRLALAAFVLVNQALWGVLVCSEMEVLVQVLLTVATAVTGAVILLQWTQRQIHRGEKPVSSKLCIRQLLWMTTTTALLIAAGKLTDNRFGLSNSVIALVVSCAGLWLLLQGILLGTWWWVAVLTLPIVAFQYGLIAVLIDGDVRLAEAQIMRHGGSVFGFYFVSVLLLALMRSGGHRWEVADRVTSR